MSYFAKVLLVAFKPDLSGASKSLFLLELAGRKGHRKSNRYVLYQYSEEFPNEHRTIFTHLISREYSVLELEMAVRLFHRESHEPFGVNSDFWKKTTMWLNIFHRIYFKSEGLKPPRNDWVRLRTPRKHSRIRGKYRN